jgi:hypothetical protein
MHDHRDVRTAIADAERAATAGDYELAEQHLRDAVALQRAVLGSAHPDLANTLNNLGVACEYVGKLDDAEEAYRQAYAIARQALPPDHPLAVRSAENLRDFCQARGRPFDAPLPDEQTAPVTIEASLATEAPEIEVPETERRSVSMADSVAAPRRSSRSGWLPAVVALAIVAIFVWALLGPSADPPGDTPEIDAGPTGGSPTVEPPPLPAGPLQAGRAEPDRDTSMQVDVAPDQQVHAPEPAPAAAPAPPASSTHDGLVMLAEVCQRFSRPSGGGEWLCEPIGDVAMRGTLVFYTRIKSPRDITIEHLWYSGDRLDRRAELRVGANPWTGYRTFSRNVIATGDRAGDWRVELRAQDGSLLYERRFTVR